MVKLDSRRHGDECVREGATSARWKSVPECATTPKRISFENKQKLSRIVLDKVVVNEWKVDVYYNIPLLKPTPTPEDKLSTKFDLRSTCIFMLSST